MATEGDDRPRYVRRAASEWAQEPPEGQAASWYYVPRRSAWPGLEVGDAVSFGRAQDGTRWAIVWDAVRLDALAHLFVPGTPLPEGMEVPLQSAPDMVKGRELDDLCAFMATERRVLPCEEANVRAEVSARRLMAETAHLARWLDPWLKDGQGHYLVTNDGADLLRVRGPRECCEVWLGEYQYDDAFAAVLMGDWRASGDDLGCGPEGTFLEGGLAMEDVTPSDVGGWEELDRRLVGEWAWTPLTKAKATRLFCDKLGLGSPTGGEMPVPPRESSTSDVLAQARAGHPRRWWYAPAEHVVMTPDLMTLDEGAGQRTVTWANEVSTSWLLGTILFGESVGDEVTWTEEEPATRFVEGHGDTRWVEANRGNLIALWADERGLMVDTQVVRAVDEASRAEAAAVTPEGPASEGQRGVGPSQGDWREAAVAALAPKVAEGLGCDVQELMAAASSDGGLEGDFEKALTGRMRKAWANRETGRPRVGGWVELYGAANPREPYSWEEDVDITPALELLSDEELVRVADPRAESVKGHDVWADMDHVGDLCVEAGVLVGNDGVQVHYDHALETDGPDQGITREDVAEMEDADWEDSLTDMGRYVEARIGRPVRELYGGAAPSASQVMGAAKASSSLGDVVGTRRGACGRCA